MYLADLCAHELASCEPYSFIDARVTYVGTRRGIPILYMMRCNVVRSYTYSCTPNHK